MDGIGLITMIENKTMNKLQKFLKPSPVTFDEQRHVYYLIEGNKMVPGVTGVLSELNKPYLMAWTTKENYKYMVEHYKEVAFAVKKRDLVKYEQICLAAKSAYLTKSKAAADSGTVAHDYIEKYVNNKIEGLPVDVNHIPKPEDPRAVECIRAFFAWEKNNKVDWLASELVVGSKIHEFGGKLDAIAHINGVFTLIDFKTSNQISKEHFLQTAAYALALKEMGLEVWSRIILRIDKEGKGFEEMVVPTPIDFDQDAFVQIRNYSRWNSYVSSHVLKDGKIVGQTKGEIAKTKIKVVKPKKIKNEKEGKEVNSKAN